MLLYQKLSLILLFYCQNKFVAAIVTSNYNSLNQKSEDKKIDLQEHLVKEKWIDYKMKYNLNFFLEEDTRRYIIFKDNLDLINQFNSEKHSYKLGINRFAHWSHEEYLVWLEEGKLTDEMTQNLSNSHFSKDSEPISDRDWREEGMVTPVKDQFTCGGCYAFAVNGAIESHYLIKKGQELDLSEQDLIDCSRSVGNRGCRGGFIPLTYNFIKSMGVLPEKYYPYTSQDGVCKRNEMPLSELTFISQFMIINRYNEEEMARVVSRTGPISTAIDASDPSFKFYKEGIYDSRRCSNILVNHAVLIVGLGSDPQPYWIVKNSWGTSFGEDGYVKMARSKNLCGISVQASYPVI